MENIVKGWFTTLLGCGVMCLSIYEWWMTPDGKPVDWLDVSVPFVAGFALIYMKDKISDWITELFKTLIDFIKSKFQK